MYLGLPWVMSQWSGRCVPPTFRASPRLRRAKICGRRSSHARSGKNLVGKSSASAPAPLWTSGEWRGKTGRSDSRNAAARYRQFCQDM